MKKILFCLFIFVCFFSVSWWAKIWFSIPTTYVVENCPTRIDVILDTAWYMTTAMDLRILLNPSSFVFNDFDWTDWLFKIYTLPIVSPVSYWEYRWHNTVYSLLSTMSRWWVVGSGKIWTITITPVTWAKYLDLQFYMIPNNDVDDTSVIVVSWSTTYDILVKADSLFLPVVQGVCDDEIFALLRLRQEALALKKSHDSAVVIMENPSFTSQFRFREYIDSVFSWCVVHSTLIILIVLGILIVSILIVLVSIYRK